MNKVVEGNILNTETSQPIVAVKQVSVLHKTIEGKMILSINTLECKGIKGSRKMNVVSFAEKCIPVDLRKAKKWLKENNFDESILKKLE